MSRGMFNSSGGGGSSSGRGVGLLIELPYPLNIIAIVIVVVLAIVVVVAEMDEREKDGTVYVATSRHNFDQWTASRGYAPKDGTLWFEDGSSHRQSYHCKGGQFQQAKTGANVTFCCSVVADDNPPCVEIEE